MRILIAAVVLVFLGMAGAVVFSEMGGSERPRAPVSAGAKIATISNGEPVEIADHLTDGAWTIVEFTADW